MEPIILTNDVGMEVHVLRIGAVIQRLLVPTKDGKSKVDVVLGFEDAAAYKVCEFFRRHVLSRDRSRFVAE